MANNTCLLVPHVSIDNEAERGLSCPFSIRKLNASTFLIRENDKWGEYNHVYAIFRTASPQSDSVDRHPLPQSLTGSSTDAAAELGRSEPATVIVLSDTGCGTCTRASSSSSYSSHQSLRQSHNAVKPAEWNIASFLSATINPQHRHPYLVISTHCHYDHILGLRHLLSPKNGAHVSVLVSAAGKDFITPWENLQEHSQSAWVGVEAPRYEDAINIWAKDGEEVVYRHRGYSSGSSSSANIEHQEVKINTGITILQTPGHTPDSLAWYDSQERIVCVGDSFYERESWDSKHSKWGNEVPMPTMFDIESSLKDWWESVKKVLQFVRERNQEFAREVDGEREDDDWEIIDAEAETEQTSYRETKNQRGEEDKDVNTSYGHPPRSADDKGEKESEKQASISPNPPLTQPTIPTSSHALSTSDPKSSLPPRVLLASAHVTSSSYPDSNITDAEQSLVSIQKFMARILRDEVPHRTLPEKKRGAWRGEWDDTLPLEVVEGGMDSRGTEGNGMEEPGEKGRWSVQAPIHVVEEGRRTIPREEWA